MLVIGHRGAAGHVAENTLGSMRYALACAVDGVEFDVRLLGGRVIVLHDATLERTTDGSGRYDALSLAEFSRLKAANGERIPFLEDVLAVVSQCEIINVELKQPGTAALVVQALERFIGAQRSWHSRILLSSFDESTTRELAALRGEKSLGVLVADDFAAGLALALELNAFSIHIPLKSVGEDVIRRAHERGLQIFVYTVNESADIEKCALLGVDAVFSDFPERVVACRPRPDPRR